MIASEPEEDDDDDLKPYVPMTIEEARAAIERRAEARKLRFGVRTPEEEEAAKARWRAAKNRTQRRLRAELQSYPDHFLRTPPKY